MPKRLNSYDVESVREAWDRAAKAYSEGQEGGRDYYRYAFFGPEHVSLCGPVSGSRILDLGCGAGYFAREMAQRGAAVTAVDISPEMLRHAKRLEAEAPLGILYFEADAANLGDLVEDGTFDMVVSCLALQDMPDVPGVLSEARRALRPGGRLVASITHPCSDTPHREWQRDEDGAKQWLCIDRYFERGPLEYTWRGWAYEFKTPGLHATLGDWFEWFREAGFQLNRLMEPQPSPEVLSAYPDLEDAARVPYYLLLDFVGPDTDLE